MKTSVTHAPFDSRGNLMHWAPPASNMYGEPIEWRPNVPFEADLTIGGIESGRSAKYVVLTDEHGRRFTMFVTDLLDALRTPEGVRDGRFGRRWWVVAKRGQNFGVKVAAAPATEHCPDYPECREERYVSDLLASVKAEEPVGKWVSGCSACEALAKGAS